MWNGKTDDLGLVFFPAFDWHISPNHPEREERLLYTRNQIIEEGLLDVEGIREFRADIASWEDIKRVHVGAPSLEDWVTEAHRVSAGCAIRAAKGVMDREVKKAFSLVRPPGHHAMRLVHGIRGFCTINVEAVMIAHLRRYYGVHRIAIVDTDVHHGDGTEEIFYNDPDTLFISFHQDGRTLYPGTGFIHEFGGLQAIGANINIPLPPGTGDEGVLKVLRELVLPILDDFKPDLIVNSAGQDNHFTDPLANMKVTAKGYATLTDELQADIAVLEGGYAVQDALPYVNTGIILAMAGLDYNGVIEPVPTHELPVQASHVTKEVDRIIQVWQQQWRNRLDTITSSRYGVGEFVRDRKRIYYDETGITEEQEITQRLYKNEVGYEHIYSSSTQGPFGVQQVSVTFIPWQATERCRKDAYDYAWKIKKERNFGRHIVVDPMKDVQEELN